VTKIKFSTKFQRHIEKYITMHYNKNC